jgi:hypothetical protein
MRQTTAFALGVLMALLAWPEAGTAQAPQSIRFQAGIRAVDCNAMTVTLDTGGRVAVYRAAGAASFYVNGLGVGLCGLQQYAGAPASVWLTALGNELLITRIDVGGPAAAPTPAAPATYTAPQTLPAPAPSPYTQPAPYPYSQPAPYPYMYPAPYPYAYPAPYPYPSIAGVVLGTIVVGGLLYLLVRGASGYLYRYPYYGSYYRHYYRPYYAPYLGLYRYAPAYRWCPGYRHYGAWCR